MHDLDLADPNSIENAFAGFPSGIAALTAVVDGAPVGFVATSFTVGVSFDPPLVLFSVQNISSTWPRLRLASRIGVSILGNGQEQACMQLASRSRDRFAGLVITTTEEGAIFLDGSVSWLDCEIQAEIPAGDHHVVVLGVRAMSHSEGAEPLVYHGRKFRRFVDHVAADYAA